MDEIPDTDDTSMRCDVCLEIMLSNIRLCEKGHSFCETCKNKCRENVCPHCRMPFTQQRNFKLEQLINEMKDMYTLPCTYSKFGCNENLKTSEMPNHELECSFKSLGPTEENTLSKNNDRKNIERLLKERFEDITVTCLFTIDGCSHSCKVREIESHEIECNYRTMGCEWKTSDNCNWTGMRNEIEEHMKEHEHNVIDLDETHSITLSINHPAGTKGIITDQVGFYFKHDLIDNNICIAIRCFGTSYNAKQYYYEIDISNGQRQRTAKEICCNDLADFTDKNVKFNWKDIKTFAEGDDLKVDIIISQL